MEKIELHRHLDCSMRWSTLKRLAQKLDPSLPKDDDALRSMFLIVKPMQDLATVLSKFTRLQSVLCHETVLETLSEEIVQDCFQDGITQVELRYSPTFIQGPHPSLSFDQIHQAILRGLQRAQNQYPVKVGLICILQRTLSVSLNSSVCDFAISNKNTFVGIDLADNESADSLVFKELFLRAKKAGLKITVHAGEAPGMQKNIRIAIDELGADRIGHGVQSIHDPSLIQKLVREKIPLELCPTSNWLTQAVNKIEHHPFKKLFHEGVLTTINTDDPGVFDLTLSHEIQVCEKLGMSKNEIQKCMEYAAAASFIP